MREAVKKLRVDFVQFSSPVTGFGETVEVVFKYFARVARVNLPRMADARGFQIDVEQLSDTLQVPVVTAVARKGRGIKEIKDLMVAAPQQSSMPYEYA